VKSLSVASLILALNAILSAPTAQGSIGVGVGPTNFRVDGAGATSCDTEDTGATVYGGQMFTPNSGVAAAHFDLGKVKAAGSGAPDLGTFSVSGKANGFRRYGVALAPFAHFNVFAKLGITSIKTRVDIGSSLRGPGGSSATSTAFAWGDGTGYEVTKNFRACLECERIRVKIGAS
jgi:opacity protein-like surface antigen